jgi:predicted lipid-binding transport protein (Tim44 family)
VAEQRNVSNGTVGNVIGKASGGTQLIERPEPVQGARESATSAERAAETSAKSGGVNAEPKAIPFAAVSFVSGLVGLLVANLLLGPLAVVLGVIGLRADSGRRARATLGILLGIADIAVFVLLAAHAGAHHGSMSWSFFSN